MMIRWLLVCCLLSLSIQAVGADLFAQKIHYDPQGSNNKVGYLSLSRDRPIDQSTYLQFKLALEEFRKEKVIFVLLHLNTPGGEVFAATNMAEALQQMDQKDHIPVVAVIDNWALSAGALLAYSCRFIVVSNQALMGAAEPVMAGAAGQMESAPEKINSALRAEFGAVAKLYGRNPWIAEAMVDKDIILVRRQGDIIKLQEMSAVQEGDTLISSYGKLLTLDADQLMDFHIADGRLSISGDLFDTPFFSQIPHVQTQRYESWKIDFFAFLAHPLVASLLMMGLILGIYLEVQNPGAILPALIALSCLAFILLSHFSLQTIGWLEILFLLVGLMLLSLEIFLLPGFGWAGCVGILLILIGVITLLLPSWESTRFSWDFEQWNLPAIAFIEKLEWLLGALLISALILVFLTRFVTPRFLMYHRMVLREDQEGSVAGLDKELLPKVGAEAETITPLYPGGKIQIGEQIYTVLSEGEFVKKGEKVLVSKIQGSSILVRKKRS